MATNLAIQTSLIEEARVAGKHHTKRATVEEALHEYIRRRKQLEVVDLFGTIDYDPRYNYKKQRRAK
jgi:hypothetical protein